MQMDEFKVGKPALVCRWRLSNRALPLENRHLRALGARVLNGRPVSVQLVAWAKQHIEWTLAEGASRYPDGTLMIMVDDLGRAAMTVGPYKPLETTTTSLLAVRAALSAVESGRTGVAPETVWLVRGDELAWGVESDDTPSGCATSPRRLGSPSRGSRGFPRPFSTGRRTTTRSSWCRTSTGSFPPGTPSAPAQRASPRATPSSSTPLDGASREGRCQPRRTVPMAPAEKRRASGTRPPS